MAETFFHKAIDMSLLDYFAAHAPEPTKERITYYMEQDRLANPHNDSYKLKRRGELEIVCMLKYEYAKEMLKARR